MNKVRVCHNGTATQCVTYANLAMHIGHGDYLGPCGNASCNGNRAEAPVKGNATIYPNPATSEVWIDLSEYEGSACTVRIFNLNGAAVYTSHSEAHQDMVRVDVSALSSGMYFVYIQEDGQAPEVLKLTVVSNN